jgi:hypothetical protein
MRAASLGRVEAEMLAEGRSEVAGIAVAHVHGDGHDTHPRLGAQQPARLAHAFSLVQAVDGMAEGPFEASIQARDAEVNALRQGVQR